MIVVGDTSIFIGLERLDSLHLIPALYGEVHVPDAVWREWFSRPEPALPPPA
ncbi:MAG: hypothetical protein ACOZE5_17355 [Verrucomicrobiota bacterium]